MMLASPLAMVASVAVLVATLVSASASPTAPATPPWLVLRPGIVVRVDSAPWFDADEPEAALAGSAASLARDFTADAARPADIVYRPIGVRARVVRLLPRGLALVHGLAARWEAYAPVDRLIPEIPAGTPLRAAGGFAGFADFYPALTTPERAAQQLPTGTPLVALAMGAAPYDPDSADQVRVRVRVQAGTLRGQSGWVVVSYTGLPTAALPADAPTAEHACACRIAHFEGGR